MQRRNARVTWGQHQVAREDVGEQPAQLHLRPEPRDRCPFKSTLYRCPFCEATRPVRAGNASETLPLWRHKADKGVAGNLGGSAADNAHRI